MLGIDERGKNRVSTLSADYLEGSLVFKFFCTFSMFECALKRTGRLKGTGKKREVPDSVPTEYFQDVKADWEKFSKQVTCTAGLQSAARELIGLAPKKQIITGDKQLAWKDSSRSDDETEIQYALRLLCTVRNNLFHGGKYPDPDGEVSEVARNRRILEAALEVLNECYRADRSLNIHIDSSIHS